MLDRTQPDPSLNAEDASPSVVLDTVAADSPPAVPGWQRPLGWLRRVGQFFFALSFSSLTRRIVSLNLAGLIALVASILYLSQFRAGLIDARAQSLMVSAEIIAGAIAASATVETNAITIDPDRLLDLKPGESYGGTGRLFRARFSDQSGTGRAGAAPADLADQDPRPHLRSQWRPDPRQPQSHATCCASNCRRPPTRASPSER